ncbi:MAG: hypothetical protein LBT89_09700 [Planctomycetaceae bacterium]|jgi:hypothetical protein|nr:hypothetical protein [Planctomycetaceae bacterium]
MTKSRLVFVTVIIFISVCVFSAALPPQVFAEGINIFNPVNKDPKKKKDKDPKKTKDKEQTGDAELIRRMTQSMENAFTEDAPHRQQGYLLYCILFTVLGCFIAGVFYWQYLCQQRLTRALEDPAFLVRELNSVHQLTRDEISLMQSVAEEKTLVNTLVLFIEPDYLMQVLEDKKYALSRHITRSLLEKLFGIETGSSAVTQVTLEADTEIPRRSKTNESGLSSKFV